MSKASGSISAAATALALLLLAAPAGAVIDGTSDTANKYANHCADVLFEEGDDGFGPDDLRISFDPEGDAPYAAVNTTSARTSVPEQ
jgi:hypothetical protein